MHKKRGFTLIELLVVVIIVVLVVVFAVPSFKKTQENSKNQRAQAVLLDIAGAVKNYRVYEASDSADIQNFEAAAGQVTADTFSPESINSVADSSSALQRLSFLAKNNLLKPIAWDNDSNGTTFQGYKFFVCSDNFTDPSTCCDQAADALAAMVSATQGTGRYDKPGACAWVDEAGNLNTTYQLGDSI
ncbi:MAG: prepilin-type N-terminal cleavage/methylation domain-containing protein [Elusimicrobia bacterium]|nr:prepilin-type N-terminal cleavage/methylation domain-containing protein [Elusimicrobiota bacterium]